MVARSLYIGRETNKVFPVACQWLSLQGQAIALRRPWNWDAPNIFLRALGAQPA